MMTLRQRILAVIGAAALLVATLSTGLGHGDGRGDTASVTVVPGPLTAKLTWASFEEPPGGMTLHTLDGSLILRVLDKRGNVSGWSVSISTRDYSGPGGHLGADHLGLSPSGISIVRGNPDVEDHSTFDIEAMSTRPTLLWSVPNQSGDGEYDLALDGRLGAPGDQQSGYLYTVIVNINGVAP